MISSNLEGEKKELTGKEWVSVLAVGIILLILGVIAFSVPLASTMGLTFGLASVLVTGGIILLGYAVHLRHQTGAASRFFQGLLSIITGCLMFRYPETGMLGIALALSFYFFLSATSKWISYLAMKSWWSIASSIASFAMGVLILVTFPFSALWIPGTLLGIDFIIAGAALIGFSLSIKKPSRTAIEGA